MNNEEDIDYIFLSQIESQCKYAINSLKKIDRCMQSVKMDDDLWQELQSLMISLGNISKILVPVKDKYKSRGERLKKTLDINDSFAILKRNCRNYFEHFDERIEEWALKNSKGYIDMVIFKGNEENIPGTLSNCIMRTFDYDKWEVRFGDDTFEIKPVIDELIYIYKKTIENK